MMLTLIAETGSGERQHRDALQALLMQTKGTVRVASAYVTDTQLLSGMEDRDLRLLTYLSAMDIIAGSSSLDSLAKLIKAGVQCRCISSGPRLHAKVYLFDDQSALITSANLTRNALDSNIEVGAHLSDAAIPKLVRWFDMLWDKADELDLQTVARLQQETQAARTEYTKLQKKIIKKPLLVASPITKLPDLFETAGRFFVCNSNRRWSPGDEKLMHERGYAAAWEPFKFPSHMDRVEQGDAILMFAKDVGIIGIGRAKGPCQQLEPGDPDRVKQDDSREWRVPTAWLAWKKDSDAYPWKSQNSTFFDVSGDKHSQMHEAIKGHFVSL